MSCQMRQKLLSHCKLVVYCQCCQCTLHLISAALKLNATWSVSPLPSLCAAVKLGVDSDDNHSEATDRAAMLTSPAAGCNNTDASGGPDSISAQPFSLPKQIHSSASLVNGVCSRLKASPMQSEATPDPMRTLADSAPMWDQGEVGRASVPHDQAHWQDEYATNWDRVGMGRTASPCDMAAAAMRQVSCPSSLHDESHAKSGKGRAWACKLCTFAANPSHSIRCEVCETVRGSALQDFRPSMVSVSTNLVMPCQAAPLGHKERHAVLPSRSQSSKHSQHSIAKFLGSRKPLNAEAEAAVPTTEPSAGQNTDQPRQGCAAVQQEKSVTCPEWTRAEFDTEVRWQCARCKCWLQSGQKAEHDDYHLALDLQHESSAGHRTYIVSGIDHNKRQKSCKTA